jgi:hypothetical protein
MFVLLQYFVQSCVTGFLLFYISQKDRLFLQSALVQVHQTASDKQHPYHSKIALVLQKLAIYYSGRLVEVSALDSYLAVLELAAAQPRSPDLHPQITGHTRPVLELAAAQPRSPDLHLQTTGHTHPVLAVVAVLELAVVAVLELELAVVAAVERELAVVAVLELELAVVAAVERELAVGA